MNFEIKNLDKIMAKANKMAVNVDNTVKDSLNKSMATVQGDIKALVPVNTGELRNSIQLKIAEEKDGVITSTVGTNVYYAPYIEYGTGKVGEATNTQKGTNYRQTPWIYCDEDGTFHYTEGQAAQPFMYPGFNQNKGLIKQNLKSDIRKLINGR